MTGSNAIDIKRHGQFSALATVNRVSGRYELRSGVRFKIDLNANSIDLSVSESSGGGTISPVSLTPEEFWDLISKLGDRIALADRRNASGT